MILDMTGMLYWTTIRFYSISILSQCWIGYFKEQQFLLFFGYLSAGEDLATKTTHSMSLIEFLTVSHERPMPGVSACICLLKWNLRLWDRSRRKRDWVCWLGLGRLGLGVLQCSSERYI